MPAFLDFATNPLWLNCTVFAVGAALVWLAGSRISWYADAIAERTGIGRAFIGMMLLGGITSLPEVATTLTASLTGNPDLAVNNILGGVALQVVILALADFMVGRDALSSVIAKPVVLLQGVFGILLLVIVCVAIELGDTLVFGVGIATWIIALLFLLFTLLLRQYEHSAGWRAIGLASGTGNAASHEQGDSPGSHPHQPDGIEDVDQARKARAAHDRSLQNLIVLTALAAVGITVAGFFLTRTGEAIAEQTGLGTSFVGAALVGGATSLPEVSTVLAAVQLRRYEMAVSDIFGTNLFDLLLLAVSDAAYGGEAVLSGAGSFGLVAALLGIAVTTIFVAGLIERKNVAMFRMGPDSIAVILVYAAGLSLLYTLR